MRYSKTHKEETRQQLVDAAGALVKEKGFAATGVDSLAAAAGLTGGGFYAHFSSKAQLLQAIIGNETKQGQARMGVTGGSDAAVSPQQVRDALAMYLSVAHVQFPQMGCILPSLLPEIARSDRQTRQVFADGVAQWAEKLAPLMTDPSKVYPLLALLGGSVAMARALPDAALREKLLAQSLQMATDLLTHLPAGA